MSNGENMKNKVYMGILYKDAYAALHPYKKDNVTEREIGLACHAIVDIAEINGLTVKAFAQKVIDAEKKDGVLTKLLYKLVDTTEDKKAYLAAINGLKGFTGASSSSLYISIISKLLLLGAIWWVLNKLVG